MFMGSMMVNDRSIYQSHGWYGHPPKRLTGKTGFLALVPPMSSGKPDGSAIGGRDFQAQPLGRHSADRSPWVHAEYRGGSDGFFGYDRTLRLGWWWSIHDRDRTYGLNFTCFFCGTKSTYIYKGYNPFTKYHGHPSIFQGTMTFPTKREKENHRLKSAGW